MNHERKDARNAKRQREQDNLAKRKKLEKAAPDLLAVCKMVDNSIFQDRDGEWELSRPAEFLKTIAEEAIAKAE